MQVMQTMHTLPTTEFLTARQVQEMLRVDSSTIYRMAGDGRLPAIKVGNQWRFPADGIRRLLDQPIGGEVAPNCGVEVRRAHAILDVAAERLGVMMVVADLDGRPVTPVVNPSPWYADRADDPDVVADCVAEWKALGDDLDLAPRLKLGKFGFECARAFVRSGSSLVAMLLAGGVAPAGTDDPAFHQLDDGGRRHLLEAMPVVAELVHRCAVLPTLPDERNRS